MKFPTAEDGPEFFAAYSLGSDSLSRGKFADAFRYGLVALLMRPRSEAAFEIPFRATIEAADRVPSDTVLWAMWYPIRSAHHFALFDTPSGQLPTAQASVYKLWIPIWGAANKSSGADWRQIVETNPEKVFGTTKQAHDLIEIILNYSPVEIASTSSSETSKPVSSNGIAWSGSPVWWGAIIATIGKILDSSDSPNDQGYGLLFGLVALPLFSPVWIPYVILWNLTAKCIITNRQVILHSGLLFRSDASIEINSIQSIEIKGIIGGTGFVHFRTPSSNVVFGRIADCREVKALVERLMSN